MPASPSPTYPRARRGSHAPRRASAAAPALGAALLALALLVGLGAVGIGPGLGPVGSLGPFGRAGGGAEPGAGTVVRVVDGDTLVADVDGREENVRLIGIDTPETVAPGRPVECYGAEASRRLGELLPPGTAIRLERDVEPRDTYDRLLAYVYRSGDEVLVNLAQVEGGFAEAKEYPPNTARKAELEGAEQAARAGGAGLWRACGGTDTPASNRPAGGRSAAG